MIKFFNDPRILLLKIIFDLDTNKLFNFSHSYHFSSMWDGATLEVCSKVDATTIDISRGGGGVFGGSPYSEETPIMEVFSFEGRILGSGGENILQNRISKFILSGNEPRSNKCNYFWDKWYLLHQWSLYLWNGIFLLDARTRVVECCLYFLFLLL